MISLSSIKMVANAYFLPVLVCMMVQVRYYLVIILGCGLNNCSTKQRSTHPIVLTKLANQREIKRMFQMIKHEVICLTNLVVGS